MARRRMSAPLPGAIERAEAQCERIAAILGIHPHSVDSEPYDTEGHYGVLLSPDQADALIALAEKARG